MTLSPEKVAAHKLLEEAVEALTVAYRNDDKPGITVGYLLLVNEVRMCDKEDDYEDELETQDTMGSYSKRGQSAVLSYGLAHEFIRHYNDDRG